LNISPKAKGYVERKVLLRVDEYRAKGVIVVGHLISRVMDIPYNTLRAAKGRRAEKELFYVTDL